MFNCDRVVKHSKKQCRCWYCGLLIPIGSTYTRRVGTCEGDFYVMKFHDSCEEFAVDVLKYDYDEYMFHDTHEFLEALTEHNKKHNSVA